MEVWRPVSCIEWCTLCPTHPITTTAAAGANPSNPYLSNDAPSSQPLAGLAGATAGDNGNPYDNPVADAGMTQSKLPSHHHAARVEQHQDESTADVDPNTGFAITVPPTPHSKAWKKKHWDDAPVVKPTPSIAYFGDYGGHKDPAQDENVGGGQMVGQKTLAEQVRVTHPSRPLAH